MRVLFFSLFQLFIILNSNAQIDPGLLVSIHSVADTAAMNQIVAIEEGSLIYNVADKSLYVWGGSTWVANYKYSVVENELFLEDDDFFYISLKIGVNGYKVVRYDRSDLNTEAISEGLGVQPTDLTTIQNLTYN